MVAEVHNASGTTHDAITAVGAGAGVVGDVPLNAVVVGDPVRGLVSNDGHSTATEPSRGVHAR